MSEQGGLKDLETNNGDFYRPVERKRKEESGILGAIMKGLLPFSLIGLLFYILCFSGDLEEEFVASALAFAPVIVLLVVFALAFDRFVGPRLQPLKDIVNGERSRRPEPEPDDSNLSAYAADRVKLMESELKVMFEGRYSFVIFGSDKDKFVQFANFGDGMLLDLPANQLDGDMRKKYEEITPKKYKTGSFGNYSYQLSYDRGDVAKAARFAERIFSEVFKLPDDHKIYPQMGERMK